MKIIEKATMKDGTPIQLEDWSEHNSEKYPDLYGYSIVAYPIAKKTDKWTNAGERFRLIIPMNKYEHYTNRKILGDFMELKLGSKDLSDLKSHFWNIKGYKNLLGL